MDLWLIVMRNTMTEQFLNVMHFTHFIIQRMHTALKT